MSIDLLLTFVTETCCHKECGVVFALNQDHRRELVNSRQSFFCPNGHSQWFPGKSKDQEIQELKNGLAAKIHQVDQLSAEVLERAEKLIRLKKRVRAGVCLFCKRSFLNVSRHMGEKHRDLRKKRGCHAT